MEDSCPIVKMESGQRSELRDAMNDVANTVEYMISQSTPNEVWLL